MKTLLKLLVTAAVLLATYRIGTAYWTHYQFEDAVQQAAQFTLGQSVDQLPGKVLELAQRMEIPLDEDHIAISRADRTVTIDVTYVRPIEMLPGVTRNWDFSVHASVLVNGK